MANDIIKIGAGVTKIKVCGEALLITNASGAGTKYVGITKNNSVVRFSNIKMIANDVQEVVLLPQLLTVAENDVIGMQVYGAVGDYIAGSNLRTQITVEVVNPY